MMDMTLVSQFKLQLKKQSHGFWVFPTDSHLVLKATNPQF